MPRPEEKILDRPAMAAECARLRALGRTIVFTNGAFDLLHAGHAECLLYARTLGDVLIVAINSDDSVRRYKGNKRPISTAADRAFVLACLACVDYVTVFEEDEPKALIAALRPDVLVKGGDWAHFVSGREIVEGYGGRVELAPVKEGRSSSSLIARILEAYGDAS